MTRIAIFRRAQQRGYALLLMLVLVTMGLLFTVVSQVSVVGIKWGRAQSGSVTLLQAKEALIGYAATYRDTHSGEVFGYLPCPDADGDGDADASTTDDKCASSTKVAVGLLPYKKLGLSDLRDTDGSCLWYAVAPNYKAALQSPNFEPMNWDNRGQIKILDTDGTTILADPSSGSEGGAVAVIFAVGPPVSSNTAGRGSNSNNTCGNNGKTNWMAFLESVVFDSSGNSTANPLVVTKGMIGSVSNNDQVAWITSTDIFDKIKKRSDRGELNSLSAQIATALQTKINADLMTVTAPSSTTLPKNSVPVNDAYSGQTGELPDTLTVDSSLVDYGKLLTNWKNQYRYAICGNLCGYCLSVGGTSCNAALLFGAAHTTGGPRPTQPTQLSDLFENDVDIIGDGKGGLSLLNGSSNNFTGAISYVSGSADVGICVAPIDQKPATFGCDLASSDNASLSLAGGARLVSFANGVLTLGQRNVTEEYGYADSELFGCDWLSQVQTFGTGLRAYFNFTIVRSGRGLVFAIIDGNQYPSGTTPCGKSDQLLGYAGDNGDAGYPPLNPPKIGLEIHTTTATASAQAGPGYQHAAIVYWGDNNGVATDDDNEHGAVNTNSGYPSNPKNKIADSASTGVSGNLGFSGTGLLSTGNTVHVRIDIVRSYDATARQGSYSIKAWLIKSPTTAHLADLRNMTKDFTATVFGTATTPTVSDSFTTQNLPTGAATDLEALQKIRFGFTNAQGATSASDQVITVQNFMAVPR